MLLCVQGLYVHCVCYDSPLKMVSAVHHVDQVGVLGANDWASEPERAGKPASKQVYFEHTEAGCHCTEMPHLLC